MPFPVLPLFICSKRQHGIRAGRDEGFFLIFALDSSKSLRAGCGTEAGGMKSP
jgi:hypothetical protein